MNSEKKAGAAKTGIVRKSGTTRDQPVGQSNEQSERQPDWANGLKQLYNSVVEEPIPDSFKDLLAKLDSQS